LWTGVSGDLLVSSLLGAFAVLEAGAGADQGDQAWALMARHLSWADSMSLNATATPAARRQ